MEIQNENAEKMKARYWEILAGPVPLKKLCMSSYGQWGVSWIKPQPNSGIQPTGVCFSCRVVHIYMLLSFEAFVGFIGFVGFVGFSGFVGFVGFVGIVRFVCFVGFVSFVGFVCFIGFVSFV